MKRIFYLLACAVFAVSCVYDSYETGGLQEPDTSYLSFTLKNDAGSGSGTRATPFLTKAAGDTNYREDFIDFDNNGRKDLHLFFFEGENCIFYPEQERLSLYENGSSGEKEIRIRLKPEGSDSFGSFEQEQLLEKSIQIYTVINSGLERSAFITDGVVIPLDEIKSMVVNARFNQVEGQKITPQNKFVMEATEDVYVGGWNNLCTLRLKRIASKIEMGLYRAEVEGYTAVSAEVKLVNFATRASLGIDSDGKELYTLSDEDFSTGEYIPVPLPENGTTVETSGYTEPFYSYPSDWSADISREAYLLLKINWKADIPEATDHLSYYKIPLSAIPSDVENGAEYRNRLIRNYIYRYYVQVTSTGGSDPENPLEITGNFDLLGWDDREPIQVSVQKFDWLFVEEQTVVIYPVPGEQTTTYYIPYKSSSVLDFAENPSVTYQWYNSNTSDMETKSYSSADPQYPAIELNYVENGQRYIRITSRVPNNFVPKNIKFKVQNEAQLFAIITVVHYPAVYVEAKRSSGVKVSSSKLTGGISAGKNRNLYTITTLAITGAETFGWQSNLNNKTYSVGDPKNANGAYIDNADNAWVVSPKFVVQSSLGDAQGAGVGWLAGTMSYSNASSRCKEYAEDDYGAGSWRIPTMAELYLISKLQSDSNSAVQDALTSGFLARRAWSAGTYLLTGSKPDSRNTVFDMTNSSRQGRAAVSPYVHVAICVRDIYR